MYPMVLIERADRSLFCHYGARERGTFYAVVSFFLHQHRITATRIPRASRSKKKRIRKKSIELKKKTQKNCKLQLGCDARGSFPVCKSDRT